MDKLPKYLTKRESKNLRSAVRSGGNKRDIAIFELLLGYGPRASEVGLLSLDHLNLEEGTIQPPRLKGGRTNIWPLFTDVRRALEEWLEVRDSISRRVFPGRTRGISRQRVYELMRKYGEAAGLPRGKQHPHACRHFAAVNALEAGLEVVDVQDLLGHKAISSTMVYAQITSKRRTMVAKLIDESLQE